MEKHIKLKKGQIVEGADGSKYELEGNEALVEGAGSGVEITLPEGMSAQASFRYNRGKLILTDFKYDYPCEEVVLEAYEWGKKVSGEVLLLFSEKSLTESILTNDVYLDYSGEDKQLRKVINSNNLEEVLDYIEKDKNKSIDSIDIHFTISDGESAMYGGGWVHSDLIDFEINTIVEINIIISEIDEDGYEDQASIFSSSYDEFDVDVTPTPFLIDAYEWAWDNWSSDMDDYVWEEMFN